VALNPDASADMPAYQPQTIADGRGNFFAVWSQAWRVEDQARIGVYARRYVPGSGWEVPVATIFADQADAWTSATGALDIAADGNGNATVVWGASDASWAHFFIEAARRHRALVAARRPARRARLRLLRAANGLDSR
jgi:hypothetical protein